MIGPRVSYDPAKVARNKDFKPIWSALSQGRTEEARELAMPLHNRMPYSGMPGGIIAASYFRDHMTGDSSALAVGYDYAREAHQREPFFLTRYYLCLYLYERDEYQEIDEELRLIRQEISKDARWHGVIDRDAWGMMVMGLRGAKIRRQQGLRKSVPIYPRMDEVPRHGHYFDVRFSL